MSKSRERPAGALILGPGDGRTYRLGPMRAVFKADGPETGNRYCVSEWWLEAGQDGPGPHSHEGSDELFYVIEGTASFRVGDEWVEAARGTFLGIPAGVTHTFANHTDAPVGFVHVKVPGGFEPELPAMVAWFEQQDRS